LPIWTAYLSARTLGSINNLLSRCIDQSMVERLQTDTDSLVLHYQTPSFMCKSSFPPEIRGRELYAAVQKVSTTILNGRKRPCWALSVKGSAHAVEWGKRETGDGRRETGDGRRWKLEAGSWKLEAGSWKLEAGSWKLEAGSWKLEAGSILLPS